MIMPEMSIQEPHDYKKVTLEAVEYCVKYRLTIGFNPCSRWRCNTMQPNVYSRWRKRPITKKRENSNCR